MLCIHKEDGVRVKKIAVLAINAISRVKRDVMSVVVEDERADDEDVGNLWVFYI